MVEDMSLYDAGVLVGSGAVMALAVWVLVRRRSLRWGGRVADVRDAPPDATPMEAPGLTLPYSSVDWTARPKPMGNARDDAERRPGSE